LLYRLTTPRGAQEAAASEMINYNHQRHTYWRHKMKRNMKSIIIMTVLAVLGISTFALADWGRGYGGHMGMMGPGMMGPGMMGQGWQQGGGYYGNLSADEIAKLEQQRAQFFAATEDTRQQLYEKNLALQSELAKENPDTTKASKLQNEISKLQSELDQKRLEYDIQARKSAPNYNRGYRGGYGSMMGYGPGGGGYCGW
jgi:zinc resistance-associated protein